MAAFRMMDPVSPKTQWRVGYQLNLGSTVSTGENTLGGVSVIHWQAKQKTGDPSESSAAATSTIHMTLANVFQHLNNSG